LPVDATSAAQALAVKTVSSHAAAQIRLWAPMFGKFGNEVRAAQVLLAAGGGTARFLTCENTLLHARLQHPSTAPIVRRALSLFRAGELRELRVADPKVIETVVAMLHEEAFAPAASGRAPVVSRALHSLRALVHHDSASTSDVLALLARHAATIVELRSPTMSNIGAMSDALARCARLESLSCAASYTPSAWLGLSQLHTLRSVNVGVVSFAAIAAALPRLRTLSCNNDKDTFTAAGADDLLPRLLVFQFYGWWPEQEGGGETGKADLPSHASPCLQELVWLGFADDDDDDESEPTLLQLPRALLGVRPVTLHAAQAVVNSWLDSYAAAPGSLTVGPLHRVRNLVVVGGTPTLPELLRLCAAAPQLRRLQAEIWRDDPYPSWLTSNDDAFTDDALTVSSRLRHIIVTRDEDPEPLHFARLQRITVDEEDYFAPFD
jgi:hypothetical protein